MSSAGPVIASSLSNLGKVFGASKAAKAQERAAGKQAALARQVYNQQRQDLLPYLQAGYGGLDALQHLFSPQGQSQFLNQYFSSPEYSTLADQSNSNILAGAAATHNLGSQTTTDNLARVAPTLGLQALGRQQELAGSLANLGRGAGATIGQEAGLYGQQAGSALGALGAARAGGAAAPFQGLASFGNSLQNYFELQELEKYWDQGSGNTYDPAIGAGVWGGSGGIYG